MLLSALVCDASCETCSAGGPSDCESCAGGKYLDNGGSGTGTCEGKTRMHSRIFLRDFLWYSIFI